MNYTNCSANRARLIDEPIVEMLLAKKYAKSGIKFLHSDSSFDSASSNIICSVNGTNKQLSIKRNASKYWNSNNFTITFYKDNLSVFNNNIFVFIDELANCIYIVNGIDLLKYILENIHKANHSKVGNGYYIIVPKTDMADLATNNSGDIIKYSKQIANLFESSRDETIFSKLFN